jgi:hypothetical protein
MNDRVYSLAVFDDASGGGKALYAGGLFTLAGGSAANRIARWDGASWSPLGSGMSGSVDAMAVLGDGSGPGTALYAGGGFTSALDSSDSYVARWQGCPDTVPPALDCPGALFVADAFAGAPGELVTFAVTASDDHDPSPSIVCTPPSGSFFPGGTTLVVCTATDAAGNESTCEFEVTVQRKLRVR